MGKVVLDNIVFALQRAGGISAVWQNLILGLLNENDIDKTFLEYPNVNIFRRLVDIPNDNIISDNLGFHNFKRYINPRLSERKKPFIFHSSYYRTCRNKLAKNITTVHDFTYDYYSKGLRKLIHYTQRNGAILNSDVVVCISENTKRDLLKFVPKAKDKDIRVIYNGVSEDYRPLTEKQNGWEDYVLFVGARQGYKNFEFAVHALKDTPYKLLICGSQLTENEQKLLNHILGQSRYAVKVHPSNKELNELYNSVKCFLYPSSYEGFGIPVLEAQRAGCPVIALNTSSIPEIIGDKSLLMNGLTEREFQNKLRIIDSTTARTELIAAGLENAANFSWDKMKREYIELYRSM